MIPVTHFVYFALALFLVGLGGVVFRRSVVVGLMSGQLMLAAAGLVFVAYSRWWGNHEGQGMAIAVALVGVAQLVVGLAVARGVRWVPADRADDSHAVETDDGT